MADLWFRSPIFRPIADHALLVEFSDGPGAPVSHAVQQLDRALAAAPFAGFCESVPAFVTLAVVFDPLITDHGAVEADLRRLLAQPDAAPGVPAERTVEVCYDIDVAPDLAEVAERTGLSPEAVIEAHLAGHYEVAMYGFAPGYAYLTGVAALLHLDRKPAAVRGVAAGSVIIAGAQCLVTTLTMPTGWWVIGRSPTPVLTGDAVRPFLFDVGDRVVFRRIGRDALAAVTVAGGA
jgi:inhibitor of KinA